MNNIIKIYLASFVVASGPWLSPVLADESWQSEGAEQYQSGIQDREIGKSLLARHTNQNNLWIKPGTDIISCDDYYTAKTDQGILTNNVWNKHAAKNDDWRQCLLKKTVDGKVEYGWSWSWPFGRKVIYAQPQIKIGSSPWQPEPKFDNAFPLKIADLKRLEISHHTDVSTNGDHNTALTMWLTSKKYTGAKPNKSVIAAEIMIWTYFTDGHFNPAGQKHSEIEIKGSTWEVWYQQDWNDKSGVNDNRWVNVSFRAKTPSLSVKVPALELLNYAVQKRLIADSLFIADVELGNEIMNGAGITWVKDFRVLYDK
ncbi:MAG: glycoside hydrolase family 12 [Alteromonadaceae bacterium]|nr:glycoside hydrolase family 12 [Alteromonadaceae bacterium]